MDDNDTLLRTTPVLLGAGKQVGAEMGRESCPPSGGRTETLLSIWGMASASHNSS